MMPLGSPPKVTSSEIERLVGSRPDTAPRGGLSRGLLDRLPRTPRDQEAVGAATASPLRLEALCRKGLSGLAKTGSTSFRKASAALEQ
jgi:hypothetical protein